MNVPSELTVKKIKREKWDDVTSLSVNDEQIRFIETSLQCLDDAKSNAYNMKWNFYGIYVEEKLIGFSMHGTSRILFLTQVWLDRFMIDKQYQNKGYGKKSLELILGKMYQDYKCNKIYLSVHESNIVAIELYQKLGFKKTLFKDSKGERIMRHKK